MERNSAAHACLILLGLPAVLLAETFAPDWASWQEVGVAQKGLAKIELPAESLADAQPSLADARLLNPNGQELPFFIDRPWAQPSLEMPLESMNIMMEKGRTVITGKIPQELLARGVYNVSQCC